METPPSASPMPDPGSGEEDVADGELAAAAAATGERWKRRLRRRRLGTGASLGRKREGVMVGRGAGGTERRGSEAAVVASMVGVWRGEALADESKTDPLQWRWLRAP